jgi:hypothetical protein
MVLPPFGQQYPCLLYGVGGHIDGSHRLMRERSFLFRPAPGRPAPGTAVTVPGRRYAEGVTAHRPPPTVVFAAAGALLAGLGGAWWAAAQPVRPASAAVVEDPELSTFTRIMVVNEKDGSIVYDELQPAGPTEVIVSSELPCGSWRTDERTFQQRVWAARRASDRESLCWLVRNQNGISAADDETPTGGP